MKKIAFLLCFKVVGCISLKAQDSTKVLVSDSLQVYVAKYKFGEGSPVAEVTVAIENGKLILKSKMGNAELEKVEGLDQFSIPSYQGTASFFRNEAKKVSGIHIDVMGRSMDGDKVEEK
jgi:translation initiation factor 6 (eIF-6)